MKHTYPGRWYYKNMVYHQPYSPIVMIEITSRATRIPHCPPQIMGSTGGINNAPEDLVSVRHAHES